MQECTPVFSSDSATGRVIQAAPPVFDPRTVAMKIANAIEGERNRVFVP
jgi:hypothetical protein